MNTITLKEATERNDMLAYVAPARRDTELAEDEYFALMVTDDDYPRNNSPYVIGVDPIRRIAYVGIERTGASNRPYISKDYQKRRSQRGICVVVRVRPEAVRLCYLLS